MKELRAQLKGKSDELTQSRRENEQLKREIRVMAAASEHEFWGKALGQVRLQGGRSLEYSRSMKTMCLQVLSRGIEATHLFACLHFIAKAQGRDPSVVPSLPTLSRWRDTDLRIHVNRQLEEFVTSATQLTMCLDCSAYSSFKYSAIGLSDQSGKFMILDVVKSNCKTAADLKNQIIDRLRRTGLFDQIVVRLRDIMSGTQ